MTKTELRDFYFFTIGLLLAAIAAVFTVLCLVAGFAKAFGLTEHLFRGLLK